MPGGRKLDMKKAFRAAVLVLTVALLAATAACDGLPLGGASSASGRSEVARPPASPAPTASDGTVISGCAMRVRDELEAGLASRAVRVGPAVFVSSGIHQPDRPRPGAVGNFKVMVELRPDVRVTVSLAPQATTQMSLLFDRGGSARITRTPSPTEPARCASRHAPGGRPPSSGRWRPRVPPWRRWMSRSRAVALRDASNSPPGRLNRNPRRSGGFDLRLLPVGVAVSSVRTSATGLSRHRRHVS